MVVSANFLVRTSLHWELARLRLRAWMWMIALLDNGVTLFQNARVSAFFCAVRMDCNPCDVAVDGTVSKLV